MFFGKYRELIQLYAYLWMLTLLHVEAKKDSRCSTLRWRLSGGFREYEGIIEVQQGDHWYNVCAGTISIQTVCSKLNLATSSKRVYSTNVFKASLQKKAKEFNKNCNASTERTNKTCGSDEEIDCCQPAGLCCTDITLGGKYCSGNWSDVYSRQCYSKEDGNRVKYSETRASSFAGINKNISWTTSALVVTDHNCTTSDSVSQGIVRNCSDNCLNSNIFTGKFYVSSKDECSCSGNFETALYESECYKQLEIVDVNTESNRTELCIAAEVTNGIVNFIAEDCSRFLQPFCRKQKDTDKISDTTPVDTATHRGTTEDIQIRSMVSSDLPTINIVSATTPVAGTSCIVGESDDVLVPSLITFGTLCFVIILTCCLCKYCRKSARKDPLRHNAMYNRTYDRQINKTDEEYAIISEIELDSGATIYKPPLPDRGVSIPGANTYNTINYGKDTSNPAVITLDDYSTPSDVIKDKPDVDEAAEYSTTYDDPIRHNADNISEIKCKSGAKDNRTLEKQLSATSQGKRNSEYSISRNDENVNSKSYETIIGTSKETDIDADLPINFKESGEKHDSDKSDHVETDDTKASERKSSTVKQNSTKNADDALENMTSTGIDVPSAVTDDGNYQDTNIIDGNFPTRTTKRTFEEHVCLSCLKPEHLKRLGIKLIPEKNLDDLEKRKSEPPRKTDINASKFVES